MASPRGLAPPLRRLPPMLYTPCQDPMPSCSEGSRGLSVLPRVIGVFTDLSTSPGPGRRQRSDRYTIRAGRNLPDKEFRYLRTVIVTAAVYRGFDSELALLLLTFRHRAGVTPYTSPCGFAECYVFGKQSPEPFHCDPPELRPRRPSPQGAPLIPKLRGHFAEFLLPGSPERLRMLSSPTCVGLRYGHLPSSLEAVSRRCLE